MEDSQRLLDMLQQVPVEQTQQLLQSHIDLHTPRARSLTRLGFFITCAVVCFYNVAKFAWGTYVYEHAQQTFVSYCEATMQRHGCQAQFEALAELIHPNTFTANGVYLYSLLVPFTVLLLLWRTLPWWRQLVALGLATRPIIDEHV